MSFQALKEEVYEANLQLPAKNLVIYTWGNVSGIDANREVIAIKPSGVAYDELRPDDIVLVDLDGHAIEKGLKPSSDTRTHVVLYQRFKNIKGICHTHSTHATAWAQAARPIPCFGTTQADYVDGEVPCIPVLSDEQINRDYERETGYQIANYFDQRDPMTSPMVIMAGHAPFTWGSSPADAVYHAAVLEEVAKMAWMTLSINPDAQPLKTSLIDKHYQRKHGCDAYYGQR